MKFFVVETQGLLGPYYWSIKAASEDAALEIGRQRHPQHDRKQATVRILDRAKENEK